MYSEVIRFSSFLLIGIGIGLVARHDVDGERITSGLAIEDGTSLERRLSKLENSLAFERYERQALGDELASVRASMPALRVRRFGGHKGPRSDIRELRASALAYDAGNDLLAEPMREQLSDGTPKSLRAFEQSVRERQFDRFVAAGIASGLAHAIMQREEALEMDALRARYAAAQSGATPQEVAKITPVTRRHRPAASCPGTSDRPRSESLKPPTRVAAQAVPLSSHRHRPHSVRTDRPAAR